jgi:hypothetical protein
LPPWLLVSMVNMTKKPTMYHPAHDHHATCQGPGIYDPPLVFAV